LRTGLDLMESLWGETEQKAPKRAGHGIEV
jgi:hypothetical protein